MIVYQYRIPLSETDEGFEPVYNYPKENEINKYREGRYFVVTLNKVVPHFHKDSVAVQEDVFVSEEGENSAEKS